MILVWYPVNNPGASSRVSGPADRDPPVECLQQMVESGWLLVLEFLEFLEYSWNWFDSWKIPWKLLELHPFLETPGMPKNTPGKWLKSLNFVILVLETPWKKFKKTPGIPWIPFQNFTWNNKIKIFACGGFLLVPGRRPRVPIESVSSRPVRPSRFFSETALRIFLKFCTKFKHQNWWNVTRPDFWFLISKRLKS